MLKSTLKLSPLLLLAGALVLLPLQGGQARNSSDPDRETIDREREAMREQRLLEWNCAWEKNRNEKLSRKCEEHLQAKLFGTARPTSASYSSGGNLNWTNSNASDYPVRLKSMQWNSGQHVASESSGICHGKWCLGFPKGQTVAAIGVSFVNNVFSTGDRNKVVVLRATPLRCTNDVLGTLPCYMTLDYQRVGKSVRKKLCRIFIGKTPAETIKPVAEFDISCPELYS